MWISAHVGLIETVLCCHCCNYKAHSSELNVFVLQATGDSCCFVCGGVGFKLAECEHCTRAIHIDCMDPPLSRSVTGHGTNIYNLVHFRCLLVRLSNFNKRCFWVWKCDVSAHLSTRYSRGCQHAKVFVWLIMWECVCVDIIMWECVCVDICCGNVFGLISAVGMCLCRYYHVGMCLYEYIPWESVCIYIIM